MASARICTRKNGTTYTQIRWRQDGKERSLSFDDHAAALRFCGNIDRHGPAEALHVLGVEVETAREITLTQWLEQHCDLLTGVQKATVDRYRRYIARDIAPTIGHLPLSAVTPTTIARWIQGLDSASGKTIANKHGFLSGAMKAAVKAGQIPSNPCEDRRLPTTQRTEMTFLTREEFELLRDHIPHDRWKNLATWLVTTGMRFSEATALTSDDIDLQAKTCRIDKAWKFSGNYRPQIGPPKSRKSVRTINLPPQALDAIDCTQGGFLFTNGAGNPVRSQEFFNLGWKPGRDAARKAGLRKSPRVHDLRHTCASWLIAAGVPLPVIQAHLGHENITTTIGTYGHLDRSAGESAAAAISAALGG